MTPENHVGQIHQALRHLMRLKFFYNQDITVAQLNNKEEADQILADSCCYLTFQKPVSVNGYQANKKMHGRTFEELLFTRIWTCLKTEKFQLL